MMLLAIYFFPILRLFIYLAIYMIYDFMSNNSGYIQKNRLAS